MYTHKVPVIGSRMFPDGNAESFFSYFAANGTYMRSASGEILGRHDTKSGGLECVFEWGGKFIHGKITSDLLSRRIVTYMEEHYGTCVTNCTSFAHYLTTGDFVACQIDSCGGWLVLQNGMRPIRMASRIDVGDMVVILYAHESMRTRKFPGLRSHYLESSKKRHNARGFDECSVVLKERVYQADEIRKFYTGGGFADFHAMVCVGHHQGEPVWLTQQGHHIPGEEDVHFLFSKGMEDTYLSSVPFMSLIKKGRLK